MPLALSGHVRRVRRGIGDAPNAERTESRHRTAESGDETGIADRFHFLNQRRFLGFAEGITRCGMRHDDHAGADHRKEPYTSRDTRELALISLLLAGMRAGRTFR